MIRISTGDGNVETFHMEWIMEKRSSRNLQTPISRTLTQQDSPNLSPRAKSLRGLAAPRIDPGHSFPGLSGPKVSGPPGIIGWISMAQAIYISIYTHIYRDFMVISYSNNRDIYICNTANHI